jgi:SAM-dependent methyltransferase
MTRHPRPIFIVGSPRSGTSVLTWCLGQHPNILPVEETNWIGELAVGLGPVYDAGIARKERSHLSASGITCNEFYERFGGAVDNLILGFRQRQEEMSALEAVVHPEMVRPEYLVSRSPEDPKTRWVDGTPEYSYYIYGLTRLFPGAKFIHLVRDVRRVVPSIVHFAETGGRPLVDTEEAAYQYWLGTVRACVRAERAFGSERILRVRHAELVARPEATLRACLDFVGEPFHEDCLAPLGVRINSSRVAEQDAAHDPATPTELIREAEQLSDALLGEEPLSYPADDARIKELESEFLARTAWVGQLECEWETAVRDLDAARATLDKLAQSSGTLAAENAVLQHENQRIAAALAVAEDQIARLRQLGASLDADQRVAGDALAVGQSELDDLRGKEQVRQVREVIREALPPDATVLVVSRGDDELLELDGRRAWHFPQTEDGVYAGYYPADSAEAIAALEAARTRGAEYIVFPSTARWWLDHYGALREHLEREHTLVIQREDVGVIYALHGGTGERASCRRRSDGIGELSFRCNICGQVSAARPGDLERETSSCTTCRSTVRWRSVIRALSVELFGRSLGLPDFPERPDLVGIGMSDWNGYAVPLSQKLGYTNTFYHQKPFLDIMQIPDDLKGTFDFVISSDVFEHVPPPVSTAFANVRLLLKPGGVFIVTVPLGGGPTTIEHFPELHEYEIVTEGERRVLKNRTRDGREQVFDDLRFHGGPGETLELRFFSETSLLEELTKAGFRSVRAHSEPDFEHGAFSTHPSWYPFAARP